MGTNYYVRIPKESEKVKAKLQNILDSGKLEEARDYLNMILNPVHIGKQSGGWKFLFNANRGEIYSSLTKEGINEFIRSNDGYIENEYGVRIELDEFWNKVVKLTGYDLESYYKDHPREFRAYCLIDKQQIPEKLKKENIDKYGEFESDGLKFWVVDDFC